MKRCCVLYVSEIIAPKGSGNQLKVVSQVEARSWSWCGQMAGVVSAHLKDTSRILANRTDYTPLRIQTIINAILPHYTSSMSPSPSRKRRRNHYSIPADPFQLAQTWWHLAVMEDPD